MAVALNRHSLGSQIASQLREEILLGRLTPGTPVSQQWVCELYGTSRMPARDAVARLISQGLVETTPGGHSVVARLVKQDILDAFDIEALVHGRAAKRAAGEATDAELAEIVALHAAMVAAEKADDIDQLGALNWEFHRCINLAARSSKLLAVIRNISLDLPRSYLAELPNWASQTIREHARIVDALTSRDADAAEAACSSTCSARGSTSPPTSRRRASSSARRNRAARSRSRKYGSAAVAIRQSC